jgi:hypothetical protein
MDSNDSPEQGRRSHAQAAFLHQPGAAGRTARATTVLAMVALVTVVGTASAFQAPTPPPPPPAPEFRSYDGAGNNRAHPAAKTLKL